MGPKTKNILLIISLVLIVGGGTYFVLKYIQNSNAVAITTVEFGELESVKKLTLVTQKNLYSSLSKKIYKLKIAGSTRLFCEYEAQLDFGIEINDDFVWKGDIKGDVIYVVAPPLSLLSSNISPTNCIETQKGLGVNETFLRNELEEEFAKTVREKGEMKLKSDELHRLAKLSLEEHILNFILLANRENNPIRSVVVKFE